MRISDWSSDVCSSDLRTGEHAAAGDPRHHLHGRPPADAAVLPAGAAALPAAGPAARQLHAALGGQPADPLRRLPRRIERSEEHTSELQSLMRISYAVFCLKKTTDITAVPNNTYQ